ncbi:hypothetical protein Pmani_039546 [Petrolisthes manimaculis]|uniref:Uncharacterized protein n=1 Tax=Petrolisthes manimaculis TaxID=1843537 RepID=A0AAE1NDN0_9EUCA|nr:hypothetical protein Pmani_039546 [Petrolisthes manimaculis]
MVNTAISEGVNIVPVLTKEHTKTEGNKSEKHIKKKVRRLVIGGRSVRRVAVIGGAAREVTSSVFWSTQAPPTSPCPQKSPPPASTLSFTPLWKATGQTRAQTTTIINNPSIILVLLLFVFCLAYACD